MSRTLTPPWPADRWPSHVELVAGTFESSGQVMFESTGWPWSQGRRSDDAVELEWEDMSFRVTADRIVVDAPDPEAAIDLHWNILQAAAYELDGTPSLHGFIAATPSGHGVAVLGLSGAGKTTTGRALLSSGCTLVADDLIVLHEDGIRLGRPFVRRADADCAYEDLDVGGKLRVPSPTVDAPVQLTDMLVLTNEEVPQLRPLDPMASANLLLQSAYVPFEVSPTSARARLTTVMSMLTSGVRVIAARPRSATPEQFARALIDQAESSASA